MNFRTAIASPAGFVGPVTGDVVGNVTGNTSGSSSSCTGNASTASNASGLRSASLFAPAEQTGNGVEQVLAHGLVTTPVLILATATAGHNGAGAAGTQAVTIAYGAMDATNLRFTVSSGAKYRVVAYK